LHIIVQLSFTGTNKLQSKSKNDLSKWLLDLKKDLLYIYIVSLKARMSSKKGANKVQSKSKNELSKQLLDLKKDLFVHLYSKFYNIEIQLVPMSSESMGRKQA